MEAGEHKTVEVVPAPPGSEAAKPSTTLLKPSTPPGAAPPRPKTSVFRLVRALTGDTRMLVRQQVQLAKTEMSEKISNMGREAATLAIGGATAYAGLIVFLIGLGFLLAWAFTKAGLQPVFAAFLGLAIISLLVVATGVVLLLGGIKKLSKESVAPQRTLQTLQDLKGGGEAARAQRAQAEAKPKASSEEIQARVQATESRMGETLDELGRRLSPEHINAQVKQQIRANPYRTSLIAMGAGMISGLILRRRFRRA